jgi:hypothetical protein
MNKGGNINNTLPSEINNNENWSFLFKAITAVGLIGILAGSLGLIVPIVSLSSTITIIAGASALAAVGLFGSYVNRTIGIYENNVLDEISLIL